MLILEGNSSDCLYHVCFPLVGVQTKMHCSAVAVGYDGNPYVRVSDGGTAHHIYNKLQQERPLLDGHAARGVEYEDNIQTGATLRKGDSI